ncbi:MAG: alpha/beta hydrolase [Kastovskya adunca ATA6-11-RM4]|jgi:pimeloyl-ACP methyl ester carboxylesterase|nr:alpha/beta hydrolase [Kastovskya adunca ATA6-11-RM4]
MTTNSPTTPSKAPGAKPETPFYTWKDYRCAYSLYSPTDSVKASGVPLLLIHPIGVGLSNAFWQPFCEQWYQQGQTNLIYNPDLLGCGESDKPHVAYEPQDWAQQLQHFLQTVVKTPVVVVVQGALLPVAIALTNMQQEPNLVQGLVLAGPPAWQLITTDTPKWRQKAIWNLLDSPLGSAFYRYARRRQFLKSFSERELFEDQADVDQQWLNSLQAGAEDPSTRHAVFSFLAGFWRDNYEKAIASITQPTLVVFGEEASSISSRGSSETPNERLVQYVQHLPNGEGKQISGRNVLPYESTAEFVKVVADFVEQL